MKKIWLCLSVIIVCVLLVGCSNEEDKTSLEEIIEKDNYIIVDVRTKEEYDTSHVKGAINIPYDEIDEKVELDKDKTILVYCKSGVRSNIAYTTLKDMGYDVVDLGAFDSVDLEKEGE